MKLLPIPPKTQDSLCLLKLKQLKSVEEWARIEKRLLKTLMWWMKKGAFGGKDTHTQEKLGWKNIYPKGKPFKCQTDQIKRSLSRIYKE